MDISDQNNENNNTLSQNLIFIKHNIRDLIRLPTFNVKTLTWFPNETIGHKNIHFSSEKCFKAWVQNDNPELLLNETYNSCNFSDQALIEFINQYEDLFGPNSIQTTLLTSEHCYLRLSPIMIRIVQQLKHKSFKNNCVLTIYKVIPMYKLFFKINHFEDSQLEYVTYSKYNALVYLIKTTTYLNISDFDKLEKINQFIDNMPYTIN